MQKISLNMLTLYADLVQSHMRDDYVRAASISTRTVGGAKYLYATVRLGQNRVQRYLGPADDAAAKTMAEAYRRAAVATRNMRSTVSALKRGGLPGPPLPLGRILDVVAAADLFQHAVVLVGTAAFQTYSAVLGYRLPGETLITRDVDLSVAEFVGVPEKVDLGAILEDADPTFAPVRPLGYDGLPHAFATADGLSVEVLTKRQRATSPIDVPSLTCSAEALAFQEYIAAEAVCAVALYGPGVMVRVPDPMRYAIHKLIVAQRRGKSDGGKRAKDLMQAGTLLDVFMEIDPDRLIDELDMARDRGREWQIGINASLRELGRTARRGEIPIRATEP
jgi:hypothetical protein